jgi:hypothetical protein
MNRNERRGFTLRSQRTEIMYFGFANFATDLPAKALAKAGFVHFAVKKIFLDNLLWQLKDSY